MANSQTFNRSTLALTGAIAGLTCWVLFEFLPDADINDRGKIAITAISGSFFWTLMMLLGPLRFPLAIRYSAGLAVVVGGLITWTSFRFPDLDGLLSSPHPFTAVFLLNTLPLAFFIAHKTAPQGWRDYEALFDNAWGLFVRGFTAMLFTGLFWGVLFLSNALLGMVGFTYLDMLIEEAWFALPFSGLVFGLALAVLNEMTTVVTTLRRLVLQLLRLLLPVVTVVITLFIVLVPFRGLDQIFNYLSATATMLAMALAAITLITSAIDADDDSATHWLPMVWSARILSLALPIIAGIAVFALWLRVAEYGWTPSRLLATAFALVVLGYSTIYAIAILSKSAWRSRIRKGNIWMTLAIIGLSILWLTPVINAERITANNQLARFMDGTTSVDELDLWKMKNQWGYAGQDALAAIQAVEHHPEHDALDARLASLTEGRTQWSETQAVEEATASRKLTDMLKTYPTGAVEAEAMITEIADKNGTNVAHGCERLTAQGNAGCALIVGDFIDIVDGLEGIIFFKRSTSQLQMANVRMNADGTKYLYNYGAIQLGVNAFDSHPDTLLDAIHSGAFSIGPRTITVIEINGSELFLANP